MNVVPATAAAAAAARGYQTHPEQKPHGAFRKTLITERGGRVINININICSIELK